jgi:small subunit ribosomal protein S6
MTIRGTKLSRKEKTEKYEVTYIVRPNVDEEAVDKTVQVVDDYIRGLGGTVELTEKKGRRRLAYEVKKMRDGYYVYSIFTIKTEQVAQIKRMMTLSEDIIRFLIVVHEEFTNPVVG